ncbi:MAG: RagB/SusD family nutrient uptake outer membrane protein [Bacteroidota bacterium]
MKRIHNIAKQLFTVSLLLLVGACDDDFLEQETPSLIGPDALYVDLDGLEAGLNGLYATVRFERGGSNDGGSNDIRCDMMMTGTDNIYVNRERFRTNFLNEWGVELIGAGARDQIERIWDWLWLTIASANQIKDRAEALDESLLSEDDRNRIVAEARMIRAWAYRHLTFLFGDVPLSLEEVTTPRLDWQRDPVEEIYDAMQGDLEFAVTYLPEEHIDDGKVIKAVAQHYLTELLIIREDYAGAIASATDAINGPRALITERFGVNADLPGTVFSDIFLADNSNPSAGNTEVLWVFQNDLALREQGGNGGNSMRRWFATEYSASAGNGLGLALTEARGGRGNTRSSATTFQFSLYRDASGEIIDERGDGYIWRNYFIINEEDVNSEGEYEYDGVTYTVGDTLFLDLTSIEETQDRSRAYTRKWDWTNPDDLRESRNFNDVIHLRLADTYLLLAEAYFKSGNAGEAANTINVLRRRANAPEIVPGDITIDFILDERARELYSEEQRRYTLLRNNKWVERTNLYNNIASGKIDPNRDRLYPIPQSFIDANLDVEISNNPGY